MNGYAVVIEGSGSSYSGYCPDLPGCIAVGSNADEVERLMREAIGTASLREHDEPVPAPSALVRVVSP